MCPLASGGKAGSKIFELLNLLYILSIKMNSGCEGGSMLIEKTFVFRGIDLYSNSCGGEVHPIQSTLDVVKGLP